MNQFSWYKREELIVKNRFVPESDIAAARGGTRFCRVCVMEGESEVVTPVTPALRRPEDNEGTRTRKKKKKKKEIIYRSEAEDQEEGEGSEGAGEGDRSEVVDGGSGTPPEEGELDGATDGRFLTLAGTITRGKRKGEMVEIRLTLTERELRDMARSKERLDAEFDEPGPRNAVCQLEAGRGPHVLLWTLSCSPFVFLVAFVTSFYYGTLTWYNIFLVYNEERSFMHKVLVCPLLVLCYPLLMVLLCVGVAAYAAATQLSWSIAAWWQAVADLEKGVCGWACGKLGLEDCAPYSVVELLDSDTLSGTLQSRREETSSV
ncbi:transmembrane protein 169a isoform X1 [Astyanax mexicanus]|uniref:Transmembrane protein 169a n=1 Tax=Astyanax mexicanus TaxID=7994 RepID=W5KWK1_ASTMX|nr:transmembrane protein 169a isoform X1 [Astyanax mexicanus]